MPPLPDRITYEASIVAELAPIFQSQFERALKARGPSEVPYGEFQADLQRAMAAELFAVFSAAGTGLMLGFAIVVSAGAFEETARQWAEGMSRELAAQVVATSQRMTAEAFQLAGGDALKMGEALALIYMADSRLEAIAITECTRAISAGERSVVLFFRHDEGPRLESMWNTAEDERVCNVCFPLDGHGRFVYGLDFPSGPPAHPRCRCFLTYVEAVEIPRRAA